MRHSIIALLIAAISTLGINAQNTEGSKILVFRNTGEINIFNSDSISKVELSVFDADSIEHEEFVAQVFHHKNNAAVSIPIAEIDSVAFGYRNIIEPKPGVRRLTDEEAEAISYFDGETLRYDSRLILKAGEIVYYDRITDNLPIGLCVKVNSISDEASAHKANTTWMEASEVFKRYLLTGDGQTDISSSIKKAVDAEGDFFKLELPEYNQNGVKVKGSVELALTISISDFVKDVVNDYQHAEIKISFGPKVEFSASSGGGEVELETPEDKRLHKQFPLLNGLLKLGLTLDAFMDIMAELGVEYEFDLDHFVVIEWTKHNGKSSFNRRQLESRQNNEATQKIEVHLDGEIFFGPKLEVSIGTAMDIIGAGIKLKVGPKLEGEFSLGVLQQLSEEFDQESYGKANLYLKGGIKLETYEYHRSLKNIFVIQENKLPFEAEAFADLHTIHLFPEFNSKAVLAKETAPIVQTGNEADAVTISTFVEEEIAYPLDISFEIADKESDETLAESEVIATIEKETDETQTSYTDIPVPESLGKVDKDVIVARPVINYKGYKVKAKPANVAGDMILTPNICSFTGYSTYFVSGMTPVSQHTFDDQTFIEGNLVGVLKGDPRHKKNTFNVIEFVDLSNPASCSGAQGTPVSLYGEWAGKIAGEDASFIFADNANGAYNGMPFTYKLNSPQRGGIAIQLAGGGAISFSIVDISDQTLTIIMKGSEQEAILRRQ